MAKRITKLASAPVIFHGTTSERTSWGIEVMERPGHVPAAWSLWGNGLQLVLPGGLFRIELLAPDSDIRVDVRPLNGTWQTIPSAGAIQRSGDLIDIRVQNRGASGRKFDLLVTPL